MPEYLAPGVYAEEVSFRQKSIEGVSTSTAGFVGPTRFGPVFGPPPLLTSFLDFERVYGGIDPLRYGGLDTINHLAHGVRAFFENGGKRLYVTRAWEANDTATSPDGIARLDLAGSPPDALGLEARYPGRAGNFAVTISLTVGPNILIESGAIGVLSGALPFDTVLLTDKTSAGVALGASSDIEGIYWISPYFDPVRNIDTYALFKGAPEDPPTLLAADLVGVGDLGVYVINANVTVSRLGRFVADEFWGGLGPHPDHRLALTTLFDPAPVNRSTALFVPLVVRTTLSNGPDIVQSLLDAMPDSSPPGALERLSAAAPPVAAGVAAPLQLMVVLRDGNDGKPPSGEAYRGDTNGIGSKSGLLAFEDLDDISIVAAPGSSLDGLGSRTLVARDVQDALMGHAERMRYRIAVLDSPDGALPDQIRSWRGRMNSKYGALYYPWVRVLDPFTEAEIITPPSGFVAGIYARNDVLRGVHKAPANEPVRLALDFEILVNRGQQEVLNPEGINCLRLIDQAGLVVWGARTVTSDPEWKYVNLRRYFAFLEHSIDRGTQWAVFEPNGPELWANVRRTVEDFLFNEFKLGHLLGFTPEEAYFVTCDRSTMTQNDLDNGRLVCLVGVSPLRPAEFVIFRIGQKTLEAARR